MASQTTTLFDNTNNVSTSGIQNRATDDGKLRVITGTFTTTSALTAGSHTLALCKLPKNAKVVSAELIVPASVGTSSAKLGVFSLTSAGAVSTVIDDDIYGSGKDLSSAGRVQFVTTAASASYLTTAEVAVVLSPVTTDFATAILFAFVIEYTIGN